MKIPVPQGKSIVTLLTNDDLIFHQHCIGPIRKLLNFPPNTPCALYVGAHEIEVVGEGEYQIEWA